MSGAMPPLATNRFKGLVAICHTYMLDSLERALPLEHYEMWEQEISSACHTLIDFPKGTIDERRVAVDRLRQALDYLEQIAPGVSEQ